MDVLESSGDRETGAAQDSDAPRGGRHLARNAAIVVGIVLIAFVALLATRKSNDQRQPEALIVGKAVPAVVGTTLTGDHYDIDSRRGSWVIVNFFASWCTPCKIEQPELVKFAKEHAAAGDVKVVSVVFQPDDEAVVRDFMAKSGATWPVIGGDTGSIALSFGVTAVPETYLVTPAGQVVTKYEAGLTAASLDAQIQKYSGSTDPAARPGGTAP
jgi:cytochrome c biogenesis protein CcmG/thiol:disulfide interchange protein DsbE